MKKPIELIDIINTVTYISKCNIKSKARDSNSVFCRWIYFKIAKKYTKNSLSNISKEVNRGHATVIYGLQNIESVLKKECYTLLYNDILEALGIESEYVKASEVVNTELKTDNAIIINILNIMIF